MRVCWKSCQICAMRSTGWATRAASMLNATSSPTVMSPAITAFAPKYSVKTMVALLMNWTTWVPIIAERLGSEARPHITRHLLFPTLPPLRFARHRLDRLRGAHRFDQECLVVCAAPELLIKPTPEDRRHDHADQNVERQGCEYDVRQRRAVKEHHREENEGEK